MNIVIMNFNFLEVMKLSCQEYLHTMLQVRVIVQFSCTNSKRIKYIMKAKRISVQFLLNYLYWVFFVLITSSGTFFERTNRYLISILIAVQCCQRSDCSQYTSILELSLIPCYLSSKSFYKTKNLKKCQRIFHLQRLL